MKRSFKTFGQLLAMLYAAPETAVELDCGTECDQSIQVAHDKVAGMLYILTTQRSHSGAFEWATIRGEGRRVIAEDNGGGWVTFSGKESLPPEATRW